MYVSITQSRLSYFLSVCVTQEEKKHSVANFPDFRLYVLTFCIENLDKCNKVIELPECGM